MSVADGPTRARAAADFGRVAVLLGGDSAEREVSLMSGNAVLDALLRRGVDATAMDTATDAAVNEGGTVLDRLASGGFDRAFVMLHGRGGEDGTIQGALEVAGIPYTGSGVLGSALAMDKHRTKQIWRAVGVPTPDSRLVTDEAELFAAGEALGFPLAVKPVHEGSSIGVSRATDDESLHRAWFEAVRFDREVIAEPWIEGVEYTAAILDGEPLPLVRLEPRNEFYDYHAKYADDAGTGYRCPCGLDPDEEARILQLSVLAFESVGGRGWGRVDLMRDDAGGHWFIDVNTAPGMTSHSLVPMAAKARGMRFDELVWRILETSL